MRFFQRWSVAICSALRRQLERGGEWVRQRPVLGRWIYPMDDEANEARYRRFNERYFASLYEQERMLADEPRMNFYASLIKHHVKPGDRLIDLGTGTGILAALASRQGAACVHAIDHSEILNHARRLAERNGITGVQFHPVHSRQFATPEKVDVILHEQMGDALFDEDMVANVVDLRDRLLKPGGRVLPARFDFYCEPVTIVPRRHVPFIWQLQVHGFDFSSLEWERPQDPSYYRLALGDARMVEALVGQPAPALSIDLHTLRLEDLPREVQLQREVMRPGRIDGLIVYFRVHADPGLTLTTDPLDPDRAPHWGFRVLRIESLDVSVGENVEVTLSVERWADLDTWRWQCAVRPARG